MGLVVVPHPCSQLADCWAAVHSLALVFECCVMVESTSTRTEGASKLLLGS